MNRRALLKLAGVPAAFLTAGTGLFGAWFARARERNPYYQGPPSDHFDGLRFFNPEGSAEKSLLDLFRAFYVDRHEPWPDRYPSPFRDRPPPRVDGRTLRVAAIGHASFLIQTAGLNILLDPVFAERASPVPFAGPKRVNDPGIAFDDLPRIDVVLVTHNHYDHLDVAFLSRLAARDAPRVVTPLGNDVIMRAHNPAIRAEAYDWGAQVILSEAVAVHLVPTLHWSARGIADRRKALWASFVLEGPGGRTYLVGDTGFGDGRNFREARRRFGGFRLALLPIGAYEPRWFMKDFHMNPEEAVAACLACGASYAVGHHWGTFKLTAEGVERPRESLAAALAAREFPAERFRTLRPGEVWHVPEA
ncbi:MBL fold metallo-hydrolase [Chelatococcus sp. SYSU_G07232]|uniref:MBL fold metallo-hydrolase n=1 Tax=Chelatococcus albus TaxID=3047466 RepID=A0ABT7AK20_9HYPH|nr:MBL fold metallo-hydrolase [Chelatococcus sp. SYSU_G07232]MDJ1159723.1 MBL fold metallo-hydrolase [Chelatococcus sp. SYSU_G07232]